MKMIDLLISGGTVIDGSGGTPFKADIAVQGTKITDIGDLAGAQAKVHLTADGRHICPGFIDVHSHSDTYLLIAPSAESKITQGITTEVVGNCGASAAPLIGNARLPSDWAAMEYPGTWRTVAEYRRLFDKASPTVNAALLVGHNTLHGGVVGYEKTKVTPEHMSQMQRALEQALDEGASGLSTGLLYAPGLFSDESEILDLCRTVASKSGIYTTHMRSESAHLISALEETLRIAESSGVRAQVSHLKASGKNNWHLIEKAFELIRAARERGVDVAADRYPYLAGCTDLDVVLPDWAQEGSRDEILRRLRDPESRSRIVEELRGSRPDSDWKHVTLGSVSHESIAHLRGTPLIVAAESLGLSPTEAIVEIITRDDLRTSAFFAGMSEQNMFRVLSEPYVMLGSDASLRTTTGTLSEDYPHPRAFGSFPRFLRMVLDSGFISLPDAVKKMTSMPAQQFRIRDRGEVRKSFAADLTILDLDSVRDTATYADPHGISQGVDAVIVNGAVMLRDGRIAERGSGKFLTPAR